MSRPDRVALILSLLAVAAAFFVHDRVFERMAHLEDEMAYVWEAQTISGGHISQPSPPGRKSFLVPFVVDYNGVRFGKYPLGWPLVLALGEVSGFRFLINPLLSGLGVWLIYCLGKKVFGQTVGLLAGFLTLTSPFFLMNSGSLLSHPMGLVLSTLFVLAWMDAFCDRDYARKWVATLVAAFALGGLALTRPYTALAVGFPFAIHGIYLLISGDWLIRQRLIIMGIMLISLSSLHLVWQYALTGDPFLNPYTLWWEYDKAGFGPGFGHRESGHTINQAWINTRHSLQVGSMDLFGWGRYSWIFLPFGLLAVIRDRNWRALLPISVLPTLVVIYLAYWIGSSLFGPRYFYEGLYSLTLLSGVGIAYLAGWPTRPGAEWPNYSGWQRVRSLAITAVVTVLISFNLLLYTPMRLGGMHGLYGVERAHIEPFLSRSAQELTPALVIVHTSGTWIEYGTLIELENAYLNTPFIFVIARGQRVDQEVTNYFPERNVYHYYPDTPYSFYTAPRPDP
jgi:4-amino-4-deoxy-L-arabinose transferase-like glycosyltransferase